MPEAPDNNEAGDEKRRTPAIGERRTAPVMTATSIVFLVRHGRTPLNEAGVLRGRIATPLDSVGRQEADSVGTLFAGVRLSAIVASPLSRARDTAAAIAGTARLPVTIDEDLADRDYGPWAGIAQAVVAAEFGSLDAAPGVEPADEFSRRVLSAIARAAERATSGPVVVVAHDAVNRHVLASLVPALGPMAAISQRTGCWNLLQRQNGRWSAPIVDAVPGDGRQPDFASKQTSALRRTDPSSPSPRLPRDQTATAYAGTVALKAGRREEQTATPGEEGGSGHGGLRDDPGAERS